jgi:hypothetical protein
MISDKQKEVLAFLRTVEQADIHQIYRAVSFSKSTLVKFAAD